MTTWKIWDGESMGLVLSFDTETTVCDDLAARIPELVLATACDGLSTYVIRREDLVRFLITHEDRRLIGHNIAFDFWVVAEWIEQEFNRAYDDDSLTGYFHDCSKAYAVWWNYPTVGRLHDLMLLDQLVRLAKGMGRKGGIQRRNLGKVAAEYCPELPADKESCYRLRFGELLGCHWSLVDPGFFDYAAMDAASTFRAYVCCQAEAETLASYWAKSCREVGVHDGAREVYGLFTESIQVKAAIALAKVTRNGIGYDVNYASSLEQGFRDGVKTDWDYLLTNHPDLFKYDKKGTLVLTPKGKTYSLKNEPLKASLMLAAVALGEPVRMSTGKKGGVSTSAKLWSSLAAKNDFIGAWTRTVKAKDTLKFFDAFRRRHNGRLHPSYETMKNTGRTSSYGDVNIQQIPRLPEFRRCFVAATGKKLVTVDYSYIELRTLAAACYAMLGYSVLGDTIKAGVDPHVYTAAMINSMSVDEFKVIKTANPDKFKRDRQSAKALNFGIPGGLGSKKLVDYARVSYGVVMSEGEAGTFRRRLIEDVYPELNDRDGYLSSTYLKDVARNLGLDVQLVDGYLRSQFRGRDPKRMLYLAGRVAKGKALYRDGTPYESGLVVECWQAIRHLVKTSFRQDLWPVVEAENGNESFYAEVFGHMSVTLTGRLRGGTDFCDGKNTPFQGLASDGGKLAVWSLIRRGLKVVAFVHDEIVVEVDDESQKAEIEAVMVEEMEKVMNGLVPAAVEGHVANYWVKA